jgi:hypothetical protein
MCALFNHAPDPFWAGFGGSQRGFFCCDVAEEDLQRPATNAAVVALSAGGLSELEVEAEFKDLVDETWNWQVRKLKEAEFVVTFPSKESLRMASRGGGLTLPTSKLKAVISIPVGDPAAKERLIGIWFKLFDVPPSLCSCPLGRWDARWQWTWTLWEYPPAQCGCCSGVTNPCSC